MDSEYKYEIAFSFHSLDEELATQLNELLQDRARTFIYSSQQRELVGEDGELKFRRVFSSEARIVIVLYRKEYGSRGWTRVEEEAIRDRAREKNWDFCIVISTEQPPRQPEWYPKYYVWLGLQRYGIETAAAIIERKIQEQGGSIREEGLSDLMKRTSRKIQSVKQRYLFLESENAVALTIQLSESLFAKLEQIARSQSTADIPFVAKRISSGLQIECYKISLQVWWSQVHSNTIEGSALSARIIEPDENDPTQRETRTWKSWRLEFDIGGSGENGWRLKDGRDKFYSVDNLADFLLRQYIILVGEKLVEELSHIHDQSTNNFY